MSRASLAVRLCFLSISAVSIAQLTQQYPKSPAQLELTSEVATTTDEGYPSTLRITLKNVGRVPVTLPLAPEECEPDGGIEIEMKWIPNDPKGKGTGWGHGCGTGDLPPLFERVRNDYIRLRPGEYFVFTKSLPYDISGLKNGSIEYWVQFTPPGATPVQINELGKQGYVIPAEKLETPRKSFSIH